MPALRTYIDFIGMTFFTITLVTWIIYFTEPSIKNLYLLIIGIVYVLETLSVILQVISFQTTGKRIFKMTPIHHHFEMLGWSEWKVDIVFWLVGLLGSIIYLLLAL